MLAKAQIVTLYENSTHFTGCDEFAPANAGSPFKSFISNQILNCPRNGVSTLMQDVRIVKYCKSIAFFLSLFLVEEIIDIGFDLFKSAFFRLAAHLDGVSLLNPGAGTKTLSKGMIFLDFVIAIQVAADFTLGH